MEDPDVKYFLQKFTCQECEYSFKLNMPQVFYAIVVVPIVCPMCGHTIGVSVNGDRDILTMTSKINSNFQFLAGSKTWEKTNEKIGLN